MKVELKNCYGIKEFSHEFDFTIKNVFAIYAPNGVMKTSFAKTFKDIVEKKSSSDMIYKERETKREITDENGKNIPPEEIFVIEPYDEKYLSEKISTLLVNEELREEKAIDQSTKWQEAIDEFNERFSVPFTLKISNKKEVILSKATPSIGFEFSDDEGEGKPVGKELLLEVLSQGEKRALYILNIIFEVEARKESNQKTLFIIDDIADSFDYKNKYAIIEYLKDISQFHVFYLIIMSHNFDFYRSASSRIYIDGKNRFYAIKYSDSKIKLEKYQNNPFDT